MTTLMQANSQWESRPADQRFGSLGDMFKVAQHDKTSATVESIKANALEAAAIGKDVLLKREGKLATLTNWAFSQLSIIAKAPAAYLRTLTPELAAECINLGLAKHSDADVADEGARSLLFSDDSTIARAITSEKYSRVWNADIIRELIKLEQAGPWQPAPEAFDGSRGLYLGDRDMFAFMVDNSRRIFETDKGGGLGRGFFARNNEVGSGAFDFTSFLYEYVCGNHRVWGASQVVETRVIHVGSDRFERVMETMSGELKRYAESSAQSDEDRVRAQRSKVIGKDKTETVDVVTKLKINGVGRNLLNDAYALAETRVDWYGAPNTVWGLNGALTEIARDKVNADERHTIDVGAARVAELLTA